MVKDFSNSKKTSVKEDDKVLVFSEESDSAKLEDNESDYKVNTKIRMIKSFESTDTV